MKRLFLIPLLLTCLATPVAAAEVDPTEAALLIIDVQDFYFPGGAVPL